MIIRALLAQSCLFGSSLRFNSLELRLEGLWPAKDIEHRYIEGCRYRKNIIVSLVRKPYEAISVGLFISIIKHLLVIRLLPMHFLA
jgi:hypothetical protein